MLWSHFSRVHIEVDHEAVGHVDAGDGGEPHHMLLIHGALDQLFPLFGVSVHHVQQAEETEMTATPKVSPWILALEPNILPVFIDKREPPLILLRFQFFTECLFIHQLDMFLMLRVSLIIFGDHLLEFLEKAVLSLI